MVGVAVILEVAEDDAGRVGGTRGSEGKVSIWDVGMRSSAIG